MLEDRLQNACDRFFVSADRLQIYGKNCSDEAFANAVYLNTDKVLKECRKAMKNIRRASLLKGNLGRLFEDELYLIEEAYESLGGVNDMQLRGWDGVPSVLSLGLAFVRCGDLCTDPLSVMDFIAGAESGTRLTFSELTNFSVFVRMALVLYLGEIARRRVEMPRELDNALTRAEERFREGSAPSAFDRRAAAAESELHRGLEEQARIYLRTLRAFRDKKLGEAVMKASVSESLLKSDPAGVYHLSSDRTKAYVRACTQKIAKRSGMDEEAVIRQALKAADSEKGVIDKLTEHPCIVSKRKSGAAVWFICELGLPVLLSGLTAVWGNIPSAVLSLLLWHEIVLTLLNTVFPRFIFPRELCAFEFKNGVPKEFATLCVISLLGDSAETAEKYARKLEKIYLSNRDTGDEIKYGLLMDLPDSQNQKTAGDGEIISKANSAVDRLNRRYGDRFCVITREREFSRSEGKYIAPERKRGAITELAALMNGKPNSLLIGGLTRETAAACRYILTLDADTEAYPGSLKELIASAAHPQNRPQISSNGTVVSGYGIIKPRIDVELNSANSSLFARIFSGQGGTDRYSSPLSDTLWCLTGTSDFTGKGIIDARAMDKVLSGRLPREKILSHDILEGGCLRCGYAHGAEFLDGFPATVRGYYKRLGRWTRGDIQLLPWTSISVSSENGEKIINPVKPVTRLRIALNAVRSLFAACVFLSVVLFAFGLKGFGISFVTALVCLGMQLLTNILARIQRPSAVAVRRYADVYTGWRGGVMLFFSRVVFLPYEAWVSIRSAFTALWRMTVSKKKLLEWVTAAEGDRHSPTGALKTYFAMMSSVIAAAVTVIIGMDTAALALAVIWILAPLYGAYLSVPLNEEKRVGSRGKKLLTDHCRKMEHYFSSLMSSGYILPPDNYQEMPFIGWADRTSPTNIGFCFLSAVASAELGLIKRDTALERCEKLYDAVSALEKYRGNLYNWYSCSEAKPLEPRYISSVDSGNFAACAAATAEVLRSWKEPSSLTLGDKLEKMWRETDLSVFYDRDKKLMAIGLDGEKRRLGGFYDMLASEARLTSFIAIAKGDIPGDHWSALSRIMTKSSGYGGLASWSGSLFEYLMPFILLPSKEGSLLAESADFAIGTQRRRGAKMGVPWGVSECCYLGFDPAMNYQYKAHGDPSLAVGSGAGEEYAASPYSTYLSLARSPEKACKNLDCFSELGLYGSFGMCDSVDFTLSRLPDDLDRAAVRTYMTHHIGMSLCSAVNLLCENVLVKAFMSVPDFCAVDQLLCERIPETAPRKLPGKYRAGKKRDEPGRSSEHEFMFTGWERDFPPSAILSNLSWTAVVAADGRNRSTVGDRVIYRSDIGFMTAVKQGDKCLFLKNGPGKEGEKRSFYTGGDSAVWKLGFGHTSVREHVSIVRNINAEKHTIEVSTKDREEIYIAVYLEPQLCSDRRYSSHPEFERLKMRVDLNGGEKIALVKRRDSVGGDVFLALSWSCDAEGFSVSRSDVLGRSGGRDPEVFFENVLKKERSDGEPCLYLLFRIVPSEGVTSSVSLALGFSSEEETAVRNAVEALKSERRGRAYQTAVNKAGLDKDGVRDGMMMASAVCGWNRYAFGNQAGISVPKRQLWPLGVSGDLPIFMVDALSFDTESCFLRTVYKSLHLHRILSKLGIRFDLIILCDDGGNYERPSFNGVGMAVRITGCSELLNTDGGIHIVDKGSADANVLKALELYSAKIPFDNKNGVNAVELYKKRLYSAGSISKRMHSIPLANPEFGAILADIGPILIYSRNSRLLKLMPWQNDPLAGFCRNMELCVRQGNELYSLFCENDGQPSSVRFVPGAAVWERKISGVRYITSAFVDVSSPCLTFSINAEGESLPEVYWRFRPAICEHETDSVFAGLTYSDGLYSAYNPVDETGTGLFIRWCAQPLNTNETVVHGWFCGEFAFSPIDGKAELSFSISVSEAAAGVSAEFHREGLIAATGESISDDLNVETGDSRLDRYINIWSEYQIKVCRLWARSSAFQNGGAVGFRDQLQDCASLLLTSPNLLREQILKCSAHQYEAGDVMHWFHEGAPSFCRGVRTMCSDDLLWLVRETAEYVVATGDFALLEVSVPYLKSEPLSVSEHERYEEVIPSDLSESVFDHCTRAIRCFLSRGFDERGIPLILGGDWNDGFSRLGERGRGSSVWLGFFGSECLFKWSEVCALTGRKDCSAYYLETAKQISGACFAAWDGDRFIRGWDDNGVPLGTSDSPYFGIDSIAQSFSFFAPCFEAALEDKRVTALNTALKLLREPFGGVWKLFDRPVKARNLGYIGDYPAGVRENGGQYTHGAVWLAIACFRAGKPNEGGAVLRDILSVQETPNYRGEDFVIAADVSSEGRCGWSWYTGSAGWFRRAVVEEMLGIKLRLGAVTVSPSLPDDMDGYRCDIRIGSALCHISVRRTGERAEGYAELSGRSEIYIEATV